MSYRDETIVLRERLLELDAKHAKLEGRVAGLSFRLREAIEERKALRRRIEIRGAATKMKRGASQVIATFVGVGMVLGFCVGSAFLVHACDSVDESIVVRHAYRGIERIDECKINIDEPFLDDCTAAVTCAGEGTVYRGTGTCQRGAHGTEFWQHGEPSFVLATRFGRAVLRKHGEEPLVFAF